MDIRHYGNWIKLGEIDGRAVYECPVCFAVTTEPLDHGDFHIRTGTARAWARK